MDSMDVIFRVEGRLGRITLARPQALNALTEPMCAAMLAGLRAWADDLAVASVVIEAEPGRAFCAGGDIRGLAEAGRRDARAARSFFATEYRLNAAIAHFPKPYVALLDGYVMGGGAGLSVHGAYRVASENAVFAMPETAIGMFPDIGSNYFLPRLPGRIGIYLGLTGARIGASDMLHTGLATHFVPAARMASIPQHLAQGEAPQSVLAALSGNTARDLPSPPLAANRAAIDRAFVGESVEAVLEGLEREGDWGAQMRAQFALSSPTSLRLALRLLHEGGAASLDAVQRLEYRAACRILEAHDFHEGVRALLIDKDRTPRWRPAALSDVSGADIDAYLAPLAQGDLVI
jgi:enoyl-CoA hydratase